MKFVSIVLFLALTSYIDAQVMPRADYLERVASAINKATFQHIADNQPKLNFEPLFTQAVSINRLTMNVEWTSVICPIEQTGGEYKVPSTPTDKAEMKKIRDQFRKIGTVNGAKLRYTGYTLFLSPEDNAEDKRECWVLLWDV